MDLAAIILVALIGSVQALVGGILVALWREINQLRDRAHKLEAAQQVTEAVLREWIARPPR